jgi:2-methylcitrate synthase/citrate synthase II
MTELSSIAPDVPPRAPKTQGLAGISAGQTTICALEQDQLLYRGYEIHDLAENATFEEVAHVILVGHKASADELAAFKRELAMLRPIPDGLKHILREIAPFAEPMDILRTGVSYLGHYDPEEEMHEGVPELHMAKRLVAQIPTIIGYSQMVRDRKDPVDPDPDLDHAANLLWCMTGEKPSELYAKVMDVSLILYAEHEFNASTFAARVIAGTMSDLYSAVTGAIGALKGPLHGGANEAAMRMLQEVGTIENVRSFMDSAFAEKRKIMGFGHRVYKNGDHRAPILNGWGRKIAEQIGEDAVRLFDMGAAVEKIMLEEKGIFANVDFPCGMTYYTMGIPVPQYTPIFVASRVTGWCAHIMEQHANNRLIRPLSEYVGPPMRSWNDD